MIDKRYNWRLLIIYGKGKGNLDTWKNLERIYNPNKGVIFRWVKIKELTYYAVVLRVLKDCCFVDKGESLIKKRISK